MASNHAYFTSFRYTIMLNESCFAVLKTEAKPILNQEPAVTSQMKKGAGKNFICIPA